MKKEVLSFTDAKTPDSPFNHAVKAGAFIFLASQLSCDLKTGEIIAGNIESQTGRTLENIRFLLEASNSSLDNILKSVIYMRDVGEFERMDKVYRDFFKSFYSKGSSDMACLDMQN